MAGAHGKWAPFSREISAEDAGGCVFDRVRPIMFGNLEGFCGYRRIKWWREKLRRVGARGLQWLAVK